MEAKFRRTARGPVSATVPLSRDPFERFEGELASKGRALLEIPVELHDSEGVLVMGATVEWFVQRSTP